MSGLGRVLGPCALLYGFEHHRAQQEHADEVGESHQRVEGVGKNPDQIELGQSADGHDDGVEDTERLQNPIPEQEYCGTFPVHAPAEDVVKANMTSEIATMAEPTPGRAVSKARAVSEAP